MGSIHWWSCSNRNHLWCAGLPCSDRHEATDRVFVCCTHGIRHARHFHADKLWRVGCNVRHDCARTDHRHVVLCCRKHERALSHTRDRASWWFAQANAAPWLDPWFFQYGFTWFARSRRFLGRIPSHPGGLRASCWA